MKLKHIENDNNILITVEGTLDYNNADEFRNKMAEIDYVGKNLTIDFDKVTYVTSAALRNLLVIRKNLTEDTFKIINVNEEIEDIFKMTGFDKLFKYEVKADDTKANRDDNYVTLLRKRVSNNASDVAYVYREREYTWKDIDIYSQIIAEDLNKLGVKRGTHVALCCPNSINWVFAFYAIQKLGGVAVLVNNSLRPKEIEVVCEIGGADTICYGGIPTISEFSIFASAINVGESIIKNTYNIDITKDITRRVSEYETIKYKYSEVFNADDPSVVIFTSGSSGKPKAVLTSAYNQLTSIEFFKEEFEITNKDRNLAFLPFFHVFGLATGISLAALVNYPSFIPDNNHPDTLLNTIDKYKCTLFQSIPTMVLGMSQLPSFDSEKVASVRASGLGGAATSEGQMLYLQSKFPNTHFANVYGMSENAAISVTRYEDSVKHITTTVGKPIPNLEIEIRDLSTGLPLEIGKPGEVCVRSNTMVVCYYNLDIDAQPIDENGWLKTGDLGVIDEEGYLSLVGRVKELIIRNGENISPNEVAGYIAKLPEIGDVKVIGVPDEKVGEAVAAAVILRPGMQFNIENRDILKYSIAKYKVPSYFVVFDKFPLLGSGKVDTITLNKLVLEKIKNKEYY